VNKLILDENINEPLSFIIWSIAHLFHFNFFDGFVILWDLLDNCGSHVHAGLEAEASLLFILIENLHSAWRRVVPCNSSIFLFIVFSINLNYIS